MTTDPVFPVTQQTDWTLAAEATTVYFTSTATLSDPDAYTYASASSPWQTALSGSDQRFVFTPGVESNNLLLKFIGSPASASLATAGARVRGVFGLWGISELNSSGSPEFLGEFLGSAVIEIGTVEATGTAIMPNGSGTPIGPLVKFARSITPKVDRSLFPGFRVVGQEGEACPTLLVDSMGYAQFVVEMRRQAEGGTAADDLGFMYRFI
jgi:hypothetical protein